MQKEDNQFLMLMHLSQLANYVFPFGGIIVPAVLWQWKKDEIIGVEDHAKEILNFQISFLIYAIISGVLIVLLIGIPALLVLLLMAIIFPVIAAVNVSNGKAYKYPFTIKFFR